MCLSLYKTTDFGRKAVIEQLESEKKRRQDEVGSLSQEIAQRTLQHQTQQASKSAPRNSLVKKEYVAIPPLFFLAAMSDSELFLPFSTFCIGAMMGILYTNQEMIEEKEFLKKKEEDFERAWKDLKKERFELEVSKLEDRRTREVLALEAISKDLQLKKDIENSLQSSYSLYKND